MSEDIKKYRKLLENSMQQDMAVPDSDTNTVEHMAQLIVDMVKDSTDKDGISRSELRDMVRGLKDAGHDHDTIEQIVMKAEQLMHQAH